MANPNSTTTGRSPVPILLTLALALTACGRASEVVLGGCGEAANATVIVETSPQSAGPRFTADALDAVATVAGEVSATCGTLTLAVDRGGDIRPVPLFEGGRLRPPGGDDSGRTVFRPVMVEAAVQQLAGALAEAPPPATGSDPLGSIGWAARNSKPGDRVVLISDGLATSPVDLNTPGLLDNPDIAERFRAAFPKVTGRDVQITGVARTADSVPTPRAIREALFSLYESGCRAGGARTCAVGDTLPQAAGRAKEMASAAAAVRQKHPDVAGLPPVGASR